MAHSASSAKPRPAAPRRGRPTLEGALAIPSRIVKAATEIFVEVGFDAASMDLIARRANVSKRTLYERYHSKDDLFLAVIEALSERKMNEIKSIKLTSRKLGTNLSELARKLVFNIIDPQFVAIEKFIAATAKRFPQLAQERSRKGMDRLVAIVALVLKRHSPFDAMKEPAVEMNARIFLAMAVLPSLREAMFFNGAIEAIDTELIDHAVDIFVRGTAGPAGDAVAVKEASPPLEISAALQSQPANDAGGGARPEPKSTKERILHAAMRRFSRQSYDEVGLRDIAADVGVDVAYVHRSSGSKEALFVDALETSAGRSLMESIATHEDLPHAIAQQYSHARRRDDRTVEPLDIMIRSLASPAASAVLRRKILDDLATPLASRLDEPSETRAAMIVAVLVGVGIAANMLQLPGLHQDEAQVGLLLEQIVGSILGSELI